jgi:hypothetical protein
LISLNIHSQERSNVSLVQNKLGDQGQTIFGEVEWMPPKRSNMDETLTPKPFARNGGKV